MSDPPLHVLLIEDNPGDVLLIRAYLRDAHGREYEVRSVDRLADGLTHLAESQVDAVLLDLSLPDSRGIETFERVQAEAPAVPTVVLTGLDDHSLALHAVQSGAQDYLVKDELTPGLLGRALRYAIERQQLRLAASELARMKEDFVANVSHQLRTPVHSLQGFLNLLMDGKVDDPAVRREFLTRASEDAARLAALTDDLLKMSRLESPRFQLDAGRVDLGALVDATNELLEPLAAERNIALLHSAPDMALVVKADEHWLQQVLINLIENAIKFSPEGGSINVATTTSESDAVVTVADRGPGIPAHSTSSVFEKFFQVEGPHKRAGRGTGLGLYICKQIVEAHGGTIGFSSNEGNGSMFYFSIPAIELTEPVAELIS